MATPRCLQLADDAEQLGDLVEVEARGRLVEHEHLDVDGDGARDRDELLHGEGVRAEDRRGIDVDAEVGEHGVRVGPHAPPVDHPEPARLAAERDVLGDRDVRQQVDLLVDRADARLLGVVRRREAHRLARRSAARPRSRGSAPVIALMSVDLPAPFSPMSEWTSPGNMRKSTPSIAASAPKRTVAPVSSRSGAASSITPLCVRAAAPPRHRRRPSQRRRSDRATITRCTTMKTSSRMPMMMRVHDCSAPMNEITVWMPP